MVPLDGTWDPLATLFAQSHPQSLPFGGDAGMDGKIVAGEGATDIVGNPTSLTIQLEPSTGTSKSHNTYIQLCQVGNVYRW